MNATEQRWTKIASAQLKGRTIVEVRYLTAEEAAQLGWSRRPVVMQLDDGNIVYASRDDEGNDGGALFTNNKKEPVLPLLD
jgi:hypothetical protein